MTLAIIAFASIAMVACCGGQKPAEVAAECAACCVEAATEAAQAATEEAPACTKECETCPKKADCPKAK